MHVARITGQEADDAYEAFWRKRTRYDDGPTFFSSREGELVLRRAHGADAGRACLSPYIITLLTTVNAKRTSTQSHTTCVAPIPLG